MPSLIEYYKPLFFFYVVSVAGAACREHNSSFPKNTRISPIETSFGKVCSATAPCLYDGYKIDTANSFQEWTHCLVIP